MNFFVMNVIDIHQLNLGKFRFFFFFGLISTPKIGFFHFLNNNAKQLCALGQKLVPLEREKKEKIGHGFIFPFLFHLIIFLIT
jgi:hypothetical protein